MLSQEIKDILLNAEAKALATAYKNDINVVPGSSLKIEGNEIWLVDYFFNKTRFNSVHNPKASLTAWKGLRGFQIKANTTYLTKGNKFELAKKWISKEHPNRKIIGILILTPIKIYDISIQDKKL